MQIGDATRDMEVTTIPRILALVSQSIYSVECFSGGGDSNRCYMGLPIFVALTLHIEEQMWDAITFRVLRIQAHS